jgi:hypothetical protein
MRRLKRGQDVVIYKHIMVATMPLQFNDEALLFRSEQEE